MPEEKDKLELLLNQQVMIINILGSFITRITGDKIDYINGDGSYIYPDSNKVRW